MQNWINISCLFKYIYSIKKEVYKRSTLKVKVKALSDVKHWDQNKREKAQKYNGEKLCLYFLIIKQQQILNTDTNKNFYGVPN